MPHCAVAVARADELGPRLETRVGESVAANASKLALTTGLTTPLLATAQRQQPQHRFGKQGWQQSSGADVNLGWCAVALGWLGERQNVQLSWQGQGQREQLEDAAALTGWKPAKAGGGTFELRFEARLWTLSQKKQGGRQRRQPATRP